MRLCGLAWVGTCGTDALGVQMDLDCSSLILHPAKRKKVSDF